MTKHSLTRPLTLVAALAFVVSACSGGASPATSAAASEPASEPPRGIRARVGRSPVRGPVGGRPDRAHRGRPGRRHADDHRPAPRLVQLRRGDRDLQVQVPDGGQRARPDRRFRRRDRGDQGQPGQPRTAGTGRHRRRPVIRPVGHRTRACSSRTRSRPGTRSPMTRRTRTATGGATTTASSRSRSTPPSCRTSRRTGPTS